MLFREVLRRSLIDDERGKHGLAALDRATYWVDGSNM